MFSSGYLNPSKYQRGLGIQPRAVKNFGVKKEVWDWLRENNIKAKKVKGGPIDAELLRKLIATNKLTNVRWWEALEFEKEEDAALFKLTWL